MIEEAAIDGIPGDVGVVSASSTNLLTLNGATTPAISAGTLFYTVANNFHSNVVGFDLAVLLVTTNDVASELANVFNAESESRQGADWSAAGVATTETSDVVIDGGAVFVGVQPARVTANPLRTVAIVVNVLQRMT